ncbi:division/cell wall cluster transcriptional repressor MraZ [Serinicoccus kebangsaanensis]|uniref:division/cell wall cluster transcriptional repressor MraZ n=1 Tax=Serinicoccus kebangsaanensis TaxID=2602069 RepID=UPI00178C59FC|nr:division/cell wall cluster transcriptional repressor MraZ [Serinicoccus kebangsaanensis]
MFLGTYTPRLDDKGRMILPAKFRERLAGGLVITRGQEHCLYVFTQGDFDGIVAQWQNSPTSSKTVRDYQRFFLSGASDEIPDKQGRVTVPPLLRTYAGLSGDCTVIGAGNRLEIWDTDAWSSYTEQHEQSFAELSEEVVPGLM